MKSIQTISTATPALLLLALGSACSDYGFGHPDDALVTDCHDRNYPAEAVTMDERCQQFEETSTLLNVIEWYQKSWAVEGSHNHVAMTPIALPLTDDNGDGARDGDDIPDIVLISFQEDRAILRAISGDDGSPLWDATDEQLQPQGGLAGGDIDGDGIVEIIAVTNDNRVKAFEHDGSLKWVSGSAGRAIPESYSYPAIANLDGEGRPEIIVGAAILDADGAIIGLGGHGVGGDGFGTTSFAADLDQDGTQEVVVGNALYAMNGDAIWSNGREDGYPAVADFDGDTIPEIVVSYKGIVRLQSSVDGSTIWERDLGSRNNQSGPPTIGDMDGDGYPEIGVVSGDRYTLVDGDGTIIWEANTSEPSGTTSAASFDFEGDGLPEVLHIDQHRVWIFHGPTGEAKVESAEHSSPTYLEYAIIVDVDGDNEAEIVSPSAPENGSPDGPNKGITAFGAIEDNWRPGRTIWNQHAFSITNVNDDGSIPATPEPNWLTHNNFRSGDVNAITGLVLPDLRVSFYEVCEFECDEDRLHVWAQLSNSGMADVNGDVLVELWSVEGGGSRVPLDSVLVEGGVSAGQALNSIALSAEGVGAVEELLLTVDGGNLVDGDGVWRECDETNNEESWAFGVCL